MISAVQYESARQRTFQYYTKAGIILTREEMQAIEVADFRLGDLELIGFYISKARVCAKELVLFPVQTCPEHSHLTIKGILGKEETFRCRWGRVYLCAGREKLRAQVERTEKN